MEEDKYRRTATSVSFIRYHFVFCPCRRRKIFDMWHVEDRFKELTRQICQEMNAQIIALECHHDHVHLFVSCLPQVSAPQFIGKLKGRTSRILRQEFPKLRRYDRLWSRSCFVSTAGNVSAATIQRYVETQKTR